MAGGDEYAVGGGVSDDLLIYLDRWTDEVIPCFPKLEHWARWLAAPDPEWGRDAPAEDGETFSASVTRLLGDVRADFIDGEWRLASPAPEGTVQFYMRHCEGGSGWDVEFSGDTVADALDCEDTDDGPRWLACVKYEPDVVVRFEAAWPRCVIIGGVQ